MGWSLPLFGFPFILLRTVYGVSKKGLYSQSYGFSSSPVWIWELGHKEGWAPKNWYFQIVVLEKTLESPLDRQEIKPVNPKEINPEYSLEGLAEAEAPILWPHNVKSQLIGKRPWAWERWKAKGEWGSRIWDDYVPSLTQWTWIWANFGRQWRTEEPVLLQSIGSQRVGYDSNWTTITAFIDGKNEAQGTF